MRSTELTATLASLKRVLADPRVGPVHEERLQKGRRELEKIGRSGRIDLRRVFRAVSLIAETLVEVVEDQSQNQPSSRTPDNDVDKR